MKSQICAHLLLLFTLIAAAPSRVAADSGSARTSLTNTGVDADAVGLVSGSFKDSRTVLTVSVSRLTPSTVYDFAVEGVVEGTFTTSSRGNGLVRFVAPQYGRYPLLDFDPRGKQLSVLLGGVAVLEGLFADAAAAPRSAESELAYLVNQVAGSRGRAYARFGRSSSGVETFTVAVSGAPSGLAQVLVNGQSVGEMTISRGNGSLRFRSGAPVRGYLPMNFDPRGAAVDIVQNGAAIFTGTMRARAFGASIDRRSAVLMMIPAVVDPAPGTVKAKWEVTERARRKFSVEIEDAPIGAYDLLVAGVPRGVIQVVNNGGDVEGEIEFSNDDDGDELPLNFDVLGQVISIAQGGVALFEGVFDPSVLNTRPAPEAPSKFDERLASTGLDPDADAEGKYEVDDKGRHKFSVEVEDVDVGTYGVRVGGVQRASLRAVATAGGVEGEVEFRSVVERGKILLNFDPRGQLIEIVNAAGEVLFSHTFGSGSSAGGSGGSAVTPLQFTVGVIAAPGAAGSVTARYERKTNGEEKLKIAARNLPVGTYDVSIGGSIRGVLNVVVSGGETEGELEFETDPDDSTEVLMNFPVLGQEVSISQGGNVLFSRVMPAE